MCGIAGFTDSENFEASAVSLMRSLGARGPDGAWHARRGNASLVQTRLAVIDLSPEVRYPMPNEREDVWLLFNGEIYDHEAMRAQLLALGHHFRTSCDAEVVVHGYEQWGLDCFRRLNGMFAVAILDERAHELILSRDRFGIKPLVRTTKGTFAFSSDALSLVQSGLTDGEIDLEAMQEFLQFHYVPPPKTGLASVASIEPGSALIRRPDGSEREVRWAPPVFDHTEPASEEEPSLDELDAALGQAVRRQLVADVDVGVLLSGGIDSSLILSYAAESSARPIAFTVGFAGYGGYDEREQAARVALSAGVEHQVEQFNLGFAEAIELVSSAFDSPLADASAIATLQLARFARKTATVVLSGTGGDELFGGYYRHRAHRLQPIVDRLPESVLSRLEGRADRRGEERSSSLQLAASYVARLAAMRDRDPLSQYLGLVGSQTSTAAQQRVGVIHSPRSVDTAVARRHGLLDDPPGSYMNRFQEFDLRTYLPGDLLNKEDRACMRFSLEARVPLLDEAVVALAQRVRPSRRSSIVAGKLPLRRLASHRLREGSIRVGKRGFAVPLAQLFSGPWSAEAADWFRSSESVLVDGGGVADGMAGGDISATDAWALAVLAAWEQRVSRGKSTAG